MMKNQGKLKCWLALLLSVLMLTSAAAFADAGSDEDVATATDLLPAVEEQEDSGFDADLMMPLADDDEEEPDDSNVTIYSTDDHLTITIRDLPKEKEQEILAEIEQNLANILATGEYHEIMNDFIDAEKYSTVLMDYDHLLCWAATASNMLWSSGYAQDVINPYTQAVFQSVDEVFDYFRNRVEDTTGSPDQALTLFFEGSDAYEKLPPYAPLRDRPKNDVEWSTNVPDYKFVWAENENLSTWLEKLVDNSIGLLIRAFDGNKMIMSHSVTLVGTVTDENATEPEERYKGIILADSDNRAVNPFPNPTSTPPTINDERAEAAAEAVNSYTIFKLKMVVENNIKRWTIENCYDMDVPVYIMGFTYLADNNQKNPETPGNDKPGNDTTPVDTTATDTSDETVVNLTAVYAKYNYIKSVMARENWIVYSPANWIYTNAEDTTFDVYVRAKIAALKAVYLDDELVSAENGDFELVNCHNGMFIIVFNEESMKALDAGTHTLKFQIDGYDEIVKELTIQ